MSAVTKKAIHALKHFQFRQRLIQKASAYSGTHVFTFTEEFTSKTCGVCGLCYEGLGGREVFCCPKRQIEFNRDIHAARNMYVKVCT